MGCVSGDPKKILPVACTSTKPNIMDLGRVGKRGENVGLSMPSAANSDSPLANIYLPTVEMSLGFFCWVKPLADTPKRRFAWLRRGGCCGDPINST